MASAAAAHLCLLPFTPEGEFACTHSYWLGDFLPVFEIQHLLGQEVMTGKFTDSYGSTPFHVTSSFCAVFKIISLPLPSENSITVYLAVSYWVLLVGKFISIPTFRSPSLVKCTFCSSSPSFSNYVLFGLLGDILYLLWLSSLFFFSFWILQSPPLPGKNAVDAL